MVYDAHLETSQQLDVPGTGRMTPWLYVMDGGITANGAHLEKGDAATDIDQDLFLQAETDSTLVLFLVDRSAPSSTAGTISGR